jgi:hypothetical protein
VHAGVLRHPAVLLIVALEQLSIRFADLVITPTEQMMDAFAARGADAQDLGGDGWRGLGGRPPPHG